MRETAQRAVIVALHQNPAWTLAELDAHMDTGGPRAAALANLTVGALLAASSDPALQPLLAQQADESKFDALVHAVLIGAGRPVKAGYVRARLGGPRWKLQGAFQRLITAGLVERSGRTSSTTYQGVG